MIITLAHVLATSMHPAICECHEIPAPHDATRKVPRIPKYMYVVFIAREVECVLLSCS